MRAFDLVALDSEDIPFLIVEAKARPIDPRHEEVYLREIWEAREAIPYGMRVRHVLIADPASMRLYRFDDNGVAALIQSWPTVEILCVYDPDLRDRLDQPYGIASYDLMWKVDSWFLDLAYRRKSPNPPGSEGWLSVGLLDKFAKGWTRLEVPLGFVDSVR